MISDLGTQACFRKLIGVIWNIQNLCKRNFKWFISCVKEEGKCPFCHWELCTSKTVNSSKSKGSGRHYEINIRSTIAFREIGKAYEDFLERWSQMH